MADSAPSPARDDSLVKCTVCGREEDVRFGGALRNGWPMCCGYTMRLQRTEADIAAAVDEQFAHRTAPHG